MCWVFVFDLTIAVRLHLGLVVPVTYCSSRSHTVLLVRPPPPDCEQRLSVYPVSEILSALTVPDYCLIIIRKPVQHDRCRFQRTKHLPDEPNSVSRRPRSISRSLDRLLMMRRWNWKGKAGFFWGVPSLLMFIWAYFRLPECKGRSYRELDILFERRIPARKFKETIVEEEDDS